MIKKGMRKKSIIVISFFLLLMLYVIIKFDITNNFKYQSNTVVVIEKVSTGNPKILVQEVYKQKQFWIQVEDENVWNLIQKNNKYFIVFSIDKKNSRNLLQIELFGKDIDDNQN